MIDVFESQAKLDAFGAKLMPILGDMGIEAKPTVFEVYNIIEGQNGLTRHAAVTLLKRATPGDRGQATSLLDESLSISSELGMRPLMEWVLSRGDIPKA